jgi:Uma2 family endonuclease
MSIGAQFRADGAVGSTVLEARERARVFPISIEQYQQMIEERIVPEDGSVELLCGMLVRKDRSTLGEDPMGHSPLHKAVVALLTKLAARLDNDRWHMQIQLPVACPPDGEPEPDASIVRGQPRDYLDRIPGAGDVSCVIEAGHSSLERDRVDKLPIYASAGFAQYIIINLQNDTLEVHTDPDVATGVYRAKITVNRGGRVQLRLPEGEVSISAAEVLP